MKKWVLLCGFLCFASLFRNVTGQDVVCQMKIGYLSITEADTTLFALDQLIDPTGVDRTSIFLRGTDGVRAWYLKTDSIEFTNRRDWFGVDQVEMSWRIFRGQSNVFCRDTFLVNVSRIKDNRYRQLTSSGLNAWFKNTGSFFNDKVRPGLSVGESKIPLISAGALWIGGMDENRKIHASYQTYDHGGVIHEVENGYRPGLYGIDATVRDEDIWKLEAFVVRNKVKGFGASDDCYSWPYEKMRYKSYVDLDSNGKRTERDAPCVLGEQIIYSNFTDLFNESQSIEKKVGVNVRLKAFLPVFSSSLPRVAFLRYYIENVSQHDYDSFFVGLFTDYEIGNPLNDYTGCDTTLDAFFGYNGVDTDTSLGEEEAPAVGMVFLSHKMYAYTSYYPDFGRMGNPFENEHYYYFLKGRLRDNRELWYGGSGANDKWGMNRRTRYSFPGDVKDTVRPNWTDYTGTGAPGIKMGVGSVGPFSLEKGATIRVDAAVVIGLKEGNGHLENVVLLKENIRKVREYYDTDSFECYNPEKLLIPDKQRLYAFPNPFNNYINVYLPANGAYEIFDMTGTSLKTGSLKEGVNVLWLNKGLPKGIYILTVDDGNQRYHFKMQRAPF